MLNLKAETKRKKEKGEMKWDGKIDEGKTKGTANLASIIIIRTVLMSNANYVDHHHWSLFLKMNEVRQILIVRKYYWFL